MKRVGLLIIFLIFAILPCNAKSAQDKQMQDNSLPKIFVYHIPEDNENSSEIKTQTFASKIQNDDENLQVIVPEESDIVSDDVTADTSGEEEDLSEDNENDENYEITDMYSDVLQGYAEYNEDEDNTITLDNSNTDSKVNKVKIKKPEKFTKNDYSNLTVTPQKGNYFSYTAPEYSVSPWTNSKYKQFGNFKAGALYGQEIFYAELEQSSGIFSSYDFTKKFSVSTAYVKTINSTNHDYNDNFYFSPSLKLNQYFTLSESLSADISKERQKMAVSLSINPFGDKDKDRLIFDIAASQTRYSDGRTPKNKFSVSAKFKL